MTDRNKILEKIKKVMALSSSSNEAEAALALEKAQELMTQYGLSERDIHLSLIGEFATESGAGKRPSVWESNLASVVGQVFGCRIVHRGPQWDYKPSGTPNFVHRVLHQRPKWIFIGITPQEEVAAYVFAVLYRQCRTARSEFIKTKLKRCPRINKTIRANSFCEGWVCAVKSKVCAFAGTAEQEELIESYVCQTRPNLKDMRYSDPQNSRLRSLSSDYWNGSSEGKNAQLHHAMGAGEDMRRLA